MYTTRPLFVLKNSPGNVSLQPSGDSPYSGYLVLEDEESDTGARSCWGQRKETQLRDLPFPQNRILTIKYSPQRGEKLKHKSAVVVFIPVINKPLSSNRYYVIIAGGRNKGKAYTCSKEDMSICCSCNGTLNDAKPRAFDQRDIYQQVEIECKDGRFHAKSVAPDGIPPCLLGRKYWTVFASKPENYKLDEASGLDVALHACLPSLNFPISIQDTPKVVIGRWYCPFIFVKEEKGFRNQMKRSMFYEVILDQFWEEVYACENHNGEEKVVEVNSLIASAMFFMEGKEVVQDNKPRRDGMIWLKALAPKGKGVGLCLAIWGRISGEEIRRGWIDDEEVQRIARMEEYEGKSTGWKKFACYVLVERFAFWRMDGSLALSFEFRHATKVRTKWE